MQVVPKNHVRSLNNEFELLPWRSHKSNYPIFQIFEFEFVTEFEHIRPVFADLFIEKENRSPMVVSK